MWCFARISSSEKSHNNDWSCVRYHLRNVWPFNCCQVCQCMIETSLDLHMEVFDNLRLCSEIFSYPHKCSENIQSVHVAFRQVLENLQKSLESDRKSWKIVITSLLQCSMFISDNFISVLANNWPRNNLPNCCHEQSLENWMTSQEIGSIELGCSPVYSFREIGEMGTTSVFAIVFWLSLHLNVFPQIMRELSISSPISWSKWMLMFMICKF